MSPISLNKDSRHLARNSGVKEFVIALMVVVVLVGRAAALFGLPDERAVTLQDWSKKSPADFVATATGELAGVAIPVNPAVDLVAGPLNLVRIPLFLPPLHNGLGLQVINTLSGPMTMRQRWVRLAIRQKSLQVMLSDPFMS